MTFNGRLLLNNSIVDKGSIFIPDRTSLQCWTDDNTTTSGSWYYPNGTEVPINSGAVFIQRNGDRVSYLSRVGGGVDGVYSCVIPGQDGGQQTLYIGIYGTNPGKSIYSLVPGLSTERESPGTRLKSIYETQ